jgi:hypothetical protein
VQHGDGPSRVAIALGGEAHAADAETRTAEEVRHEGISGRRRSCRHEQT